MKKRERRKPTRNQKVNSELLKTQTLYTLWLGEVLPREKRNPTVGDVTWTHVKPLSQESAEVIAQQWLLEDDSHRARLNVDVSAIHELSLR